MGNPFDSSEPWSTLAQLNVGLNFKPMRTFCGVSEGELVWAVTALKAKKKKLSKKLILMLFCVLIYITMQSKDKLGKLKTAILTAIPLIFLFGGCQSRQDAPLLPEKSLYKEVKRYGDKDNKISIAELDSLRQDFPRFFNIWFQEVMRFPVIALPTDSAKAEVMSLHYRKNKMIYPLLAAHYAKYPRLHQDISNAFTRLHELMPALQKPVVYSYISEFSNTSTLVDSSLGNTVVAYSPECFLNDTFSLYKVLNDYPSFMNRFNGTKLIPSTLILNYLKSTFDSSVTNTSMIDEVFLSGKLWYTLEQVMGEDEIYEHFGYSKADWAFLRNNEGQVWHHYIISKILFSSNFKDYVRYFNYGNKTFGSGIHEDCPPRVGFYSGYRMVKALMEKNKYSLNQLWQMNSGSLALKQSGYAPRR